MTISHSHNISNCSKTNQILLITSTLILLTLHSCSFPNETPKFNPTRAYSDVEFQVSLGPRNLNGFAHQQTREYIQTVLTNANWETSVQSLVLKNRLATYNIIAKRGGSKPWVIVGAHYDSRFYADMDPDPAKRNKPVPGANDGASGVAVLLELGRVLPPELKNQVWLVFFDAEDNGQIPGFDWILGSQAFVAELQTYPDSVLIVDMVGDKELELFYEANSDPDLSVELWNIAAELGKSQFIPLQKHRLLDDHIPFREIGISAVDIIDFDYPYWHTTEDTLDKISPESLGAVGETILSWLLLKGKP